MKKLRPVSDCYRKNDCDGSSSAFSNISFIVYFVNPFWSNQVGCGDCAVYSMIALNAFRRNFVGCKWKEADA